MFSCFKIDGGESGVGSFKQGQPLWPGYLSHGADVVEIGSGWVGFLQGHADGCAACGRNVDHVSVGIKGKSGPVTATAPAGEVDGRFSHHRRGVEGAMIVGLQDFFGFRE